MTYVIHGATGAQGAPVVSALAAAGKAVTALTRNADAVVPHAQVVSADCSSAEELARVYRGADGVFVHLPIASEEDRLAYAHNIVAAVEEARPARVVFSASGAPAGAGSAGYQVLGDGPVSVLADGLAGSGVSYAVIEPQLFFENLLLPTVLEAVRAEGVLRYPLRVDFAVSWASHLDIADAAAALFQRPDISGVVSVGQYPAITGPDLADAFGDRLGRQVAYEAISPDAFRASIAPLFGDGPAAGVAESYRVTDTLPDRSIVPERSAQKLLDLTPRTTSQWLADVGL
ncbi:SDR family oxidoreductase [Amycolatopsis vastitatis]|uniref:Hydroxylase n=1 Tax=Amycolatopsis vastitatis TaxID=1905142 RepID=A0A229SMH5_9PSEU|nr:NmrA family NAD(P)-binding protein [Amycolatopsis vastitatis]OXM59994.1 hydroxylase [Amycolatopsis vastitatis]